MYTLDTNAIVYYLKDDTDAVAVLRGVFAQDAPIYVWAVTELELFAFANLSRDEESTGENSTSRRVSGLEPLECFNGTTNSNRY